MFLDEGVVPRSSRTDNHNQLGADLAKYQIVEPGDLVFNKLRTWQGGFGRSRYEGIVSPAYFVCRPTAGISSHYVDHLLHSVPFLAELKRISKWQPPSQFDTPWSQLRLLPIFVFHPRHQGAIVQFLCRELERIARAKQLAARLADTLAEQQRDVFDRAVQQAPMIELRYLLERIEQGWSPECESQLAPRGGWGILKVGCVNGGHFSWDEHKRLPDTLTPRPHLRVIPGDLLVSRSNTRQLVGSAAVVDDVADRCLMMCDLLYRLVPSRTATTAFLALALNSRYGRAQIEAVASGAAGSMPKISQRILRTLRVPDLPLEDQMAIERRVAQLVSRSDAIGRAVVDVNARLNEYRDAVTTEAVIGQLDVTAVSDRQMDERMQQGIEADRL